ncbi:MAG: ATP-binding protein [Deltaproteobacteria bacterium]|nr:ATP-binding protein [Deltaproteobacteria bacterium]
MKRFFERNLVSWKKNTHRRILIVVGQRRVGKSHTLGEFAAKNFDGVLAIKPDELSKIAGLMAQGPEKNITRADFLHALNREIIPEKHLVLLNDVRDSIHALPGLIRFFKGLPDLYCVIETTPADYHQLAASGEFDPDAVYIQYVHPLSFGEFLAAKGQEELFLFLCQIHIQSRIGETLHHKLLNLFKDYLFVGGMPEVVMSHVEDPLSQGYQQVQTKILQELIDEVQKHTKKLAHRYLGKIIDTAPAMIGTYYKYAAVDKTIQSRELKKAMRTIVNSGCLIKVAEGMPGENPRSNKEVKRNFDPAFKVIFFDTGLLVRMGGLEGQLAETEDFINAADKTVSRQFAGQELVATMSPTQKPGLCFWRRHKRGSSAEVDYLIRVRENLSVPLIINANKPGWLKGLKIFFDQHPSVPLGVRISQDTPSYRDKILTLPVYAVGQAARIAAQVLLREQ